MKRLLAAMAFVLALTAPRASADPIEIPLPEFTGSYTIDSWSGIERSVPLVLPGAPSAIRGAWLRVRGTVTVGSQDCPSGPEVVSFETLGLMQDDAGRYWFADDFLPFVSGPLDWTRPFETFVLSRRASWDFLLDGEGVITLNVFPTANLIETCTGEQWPTAQFDEVTFLLDADFPVPADVSSWGRIKGLYRR